MPAGKSTGSAEGSLPKVSRMEGVYLLRATLAQQADCVQPSDSAEQRMEIVLENNGIAHFAVLKTARWSISGPEDLASLGALIKRMQDDADNVLKERSRKD